MRSVLIAKLLFGILCFYNLNANINFATAQDILPVTDDISKNIQLAQDKYLNLANQGDERFQFYLGLTYENYYLDHIGDKNTTAVRQDKYNIYKAIYWYEKSSKNGFSPATFKLGLIYQSGILGKVDMVNAARLYKIAADRGFAEAQYNLAYLYETGKTVMRDYRLAAIWYERAAKQDIAKAMRALGILYHYGLGVEKQQPLAWVWAVRAVENGDVNAAQLAAKIGDQLTKEDKDIAKRLLN